MLAGLDPNITAALVAAGVSIATTVGTKLWLDRRAHQEDLEADYRHEQRKALRELIGRYHGGLLDYATSWNNRMRNLYANVEERWHHVDGDYARPSTYFQSTVHRFLAFLSLAQKFEGEQVFIDARFVEPRELEFVKFIKAFHWVMSDAALYDGLPYDRGVFRDHFGTDRLHTICETFLHDDKIPTFRQYQIRVRDKEGRSELEPAFDLFDGVSPAEDRLRWDRLVCLHLLTMAFVTTFGYEWQRPGTEFIRGALGQFQHPEILDNFIEWLPRLGLDEQECLLTVKRLAAEGREEAPAVALPATDTAEMAPPPSP